MKLTKTLAVLGAALLAAAPASAFELKHGEGSLSLDATPKKVVSFDLAVLDTLAALDVPVVGVPRSTYAGGLSRYQSSLVVGTLFEPDYDVLRALKPDLIFAGGRSQAAMPELSKIAPTVGFQSDTNAFMKSFREASLALGAAFDKKEQAEAALVAIDKNVAALKEVNKGKTGAMLFSIRGNVIPHVPGDRFGYAYELAGLESVLPAKDPNAPAAPRPEPNSPEAKKAAEDRAKAITTIAQADPDWLLVLDRGAINGGERTAADTMAKHPELSKTKAFQEGRVIYVDPNGWYVVGGGLTNLRTITDSLLATMKK